MANAAKLTVQFLMFASCVATLIGFFAGWLTVPPSNIQPTIRLLTMAALVISLSVIWLQVRYSRRARYVEVLAHIMQCQETLGLRCLDTTADCQKTIEEIIEEVAGAFSLVTSRHCSSWVKRIKVGSDPSDFTKFLAVDVARDKKSMWRGKLYNAKEPEHLLCDNSHLLHLLEHPEDRCFFSNNLPSDKTYRTTAFIVYRRSPRQNEHWLYRYFVGQWPLPYRSQIVVPVKGQIDGRTVVSGYLEVDASSRNIFDLRQDVFLLQIFANLLQEPLMRLNSLYGMAIERRRQFNSDTIQKME